MKLFQCMLIGTLAVLAVASAGVPARAGDGFPPFGAWVYGTRSSHGHHGHHAHHGHHGHHAHHGHLNPFRSLGWGGGFGSYGYGSYGFGSYGYSGLHLGVHVGGLHTSHLRYRSVVRASYPALGWYVGGGYPSYSSYYPYYYGGIPSVYRTYYAPAIYSRTYVPLCGYPAVDPLPIYYSARSNAARLDAGNLAATRSLGATPLGPVVSRSATSSQRRIVQGRVVSQVAAGQVVPEELLEAADQIFRAGGYREASTAYARLSLRFGASDVIWGRRFVAQVASGDLEQALVVAASADLAGVQLRRSALPTGSLSGLGLAPQFVAEKNEALAKLAYANSEDGDSLLALGRWLHLAGDEQLAEVFLARAAQLSGTARGLESPGVDDATLKASAEFVSLELE